MKNLIQRKELLEVKGVSFAYNQKKILEDISFAVKEGEMLSILGPNGAGKTTLIRIISGFLPPLKGEILLGGVDIREISPKKRARRIAVLPQSEPPADYLTVKEMVLLGRIPYFSLFLGAGREDKEIVESSLAMVGMVEFQNRKMGQLSGGERQKILIARALAQQPQLLILDEPVVHLDLSHQLEILFLLKKLQEEQNLSLICVLHDVNLASYFSDKLLLLREGRAFAYGEPREVITQENLREVFDIHALVRSNPLSARPYVSIIHKRKGKGPPLHLIAGGGSGREIMERLTGEGYSLSLGVINVGDSDHETAVGLDIECVEEAPFAPITDETFNRALQLLKKAKAIIIAPLPFGWGNIKNLELAEIAQKEGKAIFVAGNDWEERDFTGGEARERIEELLRNGARVFRSIEELQEMLEELR